jgi:hypothetical protein
VLSAGVIIILFSIISSIHYRIYLSKLKTDDHILSSIRNAYGFTYKPSEDNNSSNNTNNHWRNIYKLEIFRIQDYHLLNMLHQISIGAANSENASGLTDYKAIQKEMQ